MNSPHTYHPDFSPKSVEHGGDVYYLVQTYKDIFVGYIGVSGEGKVVDSAGIMSAEALEGIVYQPDIGTSAAIGAARAHLNLHENTPAKRCARRLYSHEGRNVLCYIIGFGEGTDYVRVNGITGEIAGKIDYKMYNML